jgi:peptide/nickel transport system substrate-binding protein
MRKSRILWKYIGLGFLLMLVIVQCGRDKEQITDGVSTLTLLYPGDETYFSHCVYGEPRYLMWDRLFDYDSDGNLMGRLAETWEHSPDYRTWKISLHKEARWHDGVPVTAHDIKFTFELLGNPEISWVNPDDYTIEIQDDKTYTITCHDSPYYSPLDIEGLYYPKHLLEDLNPHDFCKWPYWSHPIGNGPFRIVRSTPKTFVELEANPDYYLGVPKIERLILKFSWPPLTELLSGHVDAAIAVNRNDVLKLKKDPRFRSYYKLGRPHAIFWNHNNPKFKDPRVRKALTQAINRKELLGVINLPDDVLVFDVPWTKDQYRRGELPEPLPFDPEEAKRLLDNAGWRDENGDGIRERAGKNFHFTLTTRKSGQHAAVYVQDQLRRIGIRMEINVLINTIVSQRFVKGDFESILYVFKPIIQGNIFGKNYPPMGYQNARIVELFKAARDAWGPAEQDVIYKEIWAIYQKDHPVTFIRPQLWTYLAHKRVKGLRNLDRANPLLQMRHLWIEEDK